MAKAASVSSISTRTRTRNAYSAVKATSDSIRIHTMVGYGGA